MRESWANQARSNAGGVADAAGRVGGDKVVIHQAPFAAGLVQFLDG